jgi:protein-S-isoprenylcysteine O-methyltransferase Ste14
MLSLYRPKNPGLNNPVGTNTIMFNDIHLLQVPIAAGLTLYFGLHSLLASHWLKARVARRWPRLMPAYRLGFNLLSVLLLLPLAWLLYRYPGPVLWQWQAGWYWLMKGLALAAVGGFVFSLRAYDNLVFLGWRQWRNRHQAVTDPERFQLSTLHRFVRHPWYFFLLVLMWTQDIHLSQLTGYGLITLYLVIGSRLEERKLIRQHGEVYRRYRRKVPGLIPLPWRWLSRGDAKELVAMSACARPAA